MSSGALVVCSATFSSLPGDPNPVPGRSAWRSPAPQAALQATLWPASTLGTVLRVATWNVNSLKARLERVEAWVGQVHPDILCLQETKLADTAFPAWRSRPLSYGAVHHGDGRWNGVAILSRVGLDDVQSGFAGGRRPQRRGAAPGCDLRRSAGHHRLRTQRAIGRPRAVRGEAGLARPARRRGGCRPRPREALLICGDFNVAPDDRDVWDPSAVHGRDP